MKIFLKILTLVFILAAIFLAGFHFWGESLEDLFNQEACIRWFAQSRNYAWALGIGLLLTDLLLPIPATGIMAALGNVYWVFLGTLVGTIGSAGAGVTGYFLARYLGEKVVGFLASEEEIRRFRYLFDRWGGPAIIVSRILPILPEVMSLLAGLARMSLARFLTALLLGTVPTCFLFSYLGWASRSEPWFGMTAAVLLPLVIWPLFLKYTKSQKNKLIS